eukprot:13760371-Heterocapsa_arctica.AAC.1
MALSTRPSSSITCSFAFSKAASAFWARNRVPSQRSCCALKCWSIDLSSSAFSGRSGVRGID